MSARGLKTFLDLEEVNRTLFAVMASTDDKLLKKAMTEIRGKLQEVIDFVIGK